MAELACPLCIRPLEAHWHGETELDRCAGCGAIWFDAGELAETLGLEASTEKGIALAPTAAGSIAVPCPRDGRPMREVEVRTLEGDGYDGASAVVHVCGRCHGVVFSRKALRIAQRDGVRGGDTPSVNPDPSWMQTAFDTAVRVVDVLTLF